MKHPCKNCNRDYRKIICHYAPCVHLLSYVIYKMSVNRPQKDRQKIIEKLDSIGQIFNKWEKEKEQAFYSKPYITTKDTTNDN